MNQQNFRDSQEAMPQLQGLHVLLFDPDKLALKHTKSLLQQAFYTVIGTGDQYVALKMLEDNIELIDLIIIDDKPQHLDCLTFIRRIKALKPNIPVVLMSSMEVYLSATLIQVGASHVISKPITNGEIASIWKQLNGYSAQLCMTSQPVKTNDPTGRGKAVSFGVDASSYGDKGQNKKRREEDDEDEHFGNGRKKSRVYTAKLHKKCMAILEQRTQQKFNQLASASTPAPTLAPSANLPKAGAKPVKTTNTNPFQPSRATLPNTITMPPCPPNNFGFGSFPMNPVLESNPVLTTAKPPAASNDLTKFSHLVHAQNSFLATNGQQMWRQHYMNSNPNRPDLVPYVTPTTVPDPAGAVNELPEFGFGQAQPAFESQVQQAEDPADYFELDGASMNEFLEGLFDEGSASSGALSSTLFQGLETGNVFAAENGGSVAEPVCPGTEPGGQVNGFGAGEVSPSGDVFDEIAREMTLEGIFWDDNGGSN